MPLQKLTLNVPKIIRKSKDVNIINSGAITLEQQQKCVKLRNNLD